MCRRYWTQLLFGLLNTKERDEALALLRQARDHGFMIVPAAVDTQATGMVSPSAANQVTAVVIGTEFPYWDDVAPNSDGDADAYDLGGSEVHYQSLPDEQADGIRYFPMVGNNTAYEEQDVLSIAGLTFHGDWYADSPGGPLAGGIPNGLNTPRWSQTGSVSGGAHPYYGGDVAGAIQGMTEVAFENYWYSLVFDRTNPNSLYNYYFQNSHGNLAFQGDRSHVVGWLHSHHVTDRLPYPGNSSFQAGYGCTQPGTPLIRPIAPTPGPYIYRASLAGETCTMLFREDVPRPDGPETPTNFQLWAVQPFDGGGTAFNAEAVIEPPAAGWQFVRDPYDSRRWTVINNGWQYWDATLATPAYVAYAPLDGQAWRMSVTHRYGSLLIAQYHTNDTWSSPGGYGQNYGCPPLADGNADMGDPSTPTAGNGGTVFGTTDVYRMNATTTHDTAPGRMGSDVGNRLKSFCYYVTDHSYAQGTDPYQAAHLNNGAGHPDDIGGTVVSDFRDRPFPYDHDVSDHGSPNMGNVLGGGGTPGHSAGNMRADISRVLADSGIDISGYDKQIFLFPSSVTEETDTGSPIIPHASMGPGATMVTVPSNCGLTLLAHEVGHTLGMRDLYDNNLYDNANDPIPPYYECATVGPYSVMAHGVRVDPWHKLQSLQDGANGSTGTWATGTPVTVDRPTAQVPMVEGTLQEPVIMKLPAHPLAIYATKYGATPPPGFTQGGGPSWADLRDPARWTEYFLLENRNKNGASYFGDQSTRGLYIWHVDERNIGGFQRAEETLTVALEQADGLNELENNRTGNNGNMATDPFGVTGNTAFTERTAPHSWSHGKGNGNGLNETVVPETPTDSFVRVVDIATSAGATMAAKVYVEPREIWAEGDDLVASLPVGDAGFPVCAQGQEDVPVLALKLHNDSQFPNVSTGPVTIKSLKVLESGTSTNDANLKAAKLYEDTNNNGTLEPGGGDSLIATTTLSGDYAVWDNLGYQVPHSWGAGTGTDTTKTLIVAYDIAEEAETNPTITLGAEITDYTFITPDQPGAVQVKARFPGDGYNFIDPGTGQPKYRFPFGSRQALVVEDPDTLTVASTSLAPDTAMQGDKVPMMALHLSVDHEAAVVNRLTVTQIAPAYPALGSADLGTLQAYLDADGSGTFDANADTLLGAANFVNLGGTWTANITGAGVTPLLLSVEATSNPATGAGPKDVFLVLNIQPDATPGRYARLSLADNSTVGLVPNPTFPTLPDVVSTSGFPHDSLPDVGTRITDPNLPPTPPPGSDGDARWAPTGGVLVDPTPDFMFPSGDDPNDTDDPAWDENWDDLTYVVEASQDGFATVSTYTGPFTVDPAGPDHSVTFTWPTNLAAGAWEWRVRSVDPAGAQSVDSEVHTFSVNYPPNPPVAPFTPSGGAATSDNPTFTWTFATPPDPDPLDAAATLYTFIQVDDNSDFSSPLWAWDPANPMAPSVGLSTQGATSLQPGVILVRGTTYYWRAITIDSHGFPADAWGATQTFRVADNLAPNAPLTGFDPANGNETAVAHPVLSWDAATDPDDVAGALHYVVEMDTNSDWTDGVNLLAGADTTADGVTQLDVNPYVCVDNTQYFYRVQTVDGYGATSPWSATQNFWANLVNDAPEAPSSGFYPANSVNLTIQQPTLRCDQVNDPDPHDPNWPGGPYLSYNVQLRPGDNNFGAGFTWEYTAVGNVDPATVDIPVTDTLTDATHWFWRVRALDDEGLAGPWSPVQDFWVDTNNQPPTLSLAGATPGVAPQYGTLATTFTYSVLYTDVENDAPDGVTVEIDGASLPMAKADPTDNNYQDGVIYTLALSGANAALGYGIHDYRFTTQAGTVHYPVDGSTVTGPIVGSMSQTRLMDAAFGADVATYEEGQPVYIQVSDPDTNGDPATAESLTATLAVQGGGDSETVVLFETGLNTGLFRATVPTLGAAGAANDGTLNVIAGPTGQTIVASYSDPNCGPDCPAADRDDSQATAQVQDTTAPAAAQPSLVATSAANGRGINLDWTAYNEAAQVDVASYRVYLETAPFTSVAALTPLATNTPAGTFTRTLSPVLPDTDYYVAVVPIDEVPNANETVTGLLVRTAVGDTTPPAIANISPAAGSTTAQPTTPITFRLTDAGSGVDQSTLEVYVNGALVPAADLVITGTAANLLVSYTPATPFAWEQVVTVRVAVSDVDGNVMLDETGALGDGYEWTYTVAPAPRYRITGVITKSAGAGLGAAAVAVYEGANVAPLTTVMTDGNGYYVVPNLLAGTYRLVPAYTEYDFVPVDRTVTLTNSDVTDQNFVGTLRTYTIAGTVLEAGVGKAGVTVTDGTRTTTTGADGTYVLTGVPSGRYTVTPSLTNYDFRPSSRAVLVAGAAWTGVDFEAIAQTFSIAGIVRDYDGNRLQGVHVTAGGQGAITNDAGMYTISGLVAGTYEVTAAKTGYYVEIASGTGSVTIPPSATGVDFVGYMSFATTFPAGVNLIGVPCYPASSAPADVFDASQVSAVARWNPSSSPAGWVKLPGATSGLDILDVRPGRGFFVKLVDGNFEVHGRPVSTAKAFTVTLGAGWNMIANMFTEAVPFADFAPGLPGSIRPYGYVYDPATGGYVLVSATAGVNVSRTSVNPWEGMWLRTTGTTATVNVTPPGLSVSSAAVGVESLKLGTGGWTIPVTARTEGSTDATTTVGIGPALAADYELENPPMAPQSVDVYIADAAGGYLAQQVRSGSATRQSWDLVVATELANAQVTLSLPDLSQVPSSLAVYLTDKETGKRLYARTLSSYSFTTGDSGARRAFVLEVAPREAGGLVLSSASAAAQQGAVVVSYNVSRACQTTVKITNVAGRVVRLLTQGKAVAAGLNTVSWDLHSASGTVVPAGRYLVQIEGVSDDGQRTQAVTTVTVKR